MTQGPQKPKSCFDLYAQDSEQRDLEVALEKARQRIYEFKRKSKLRALIYAPLAPLPLP